MAIGDDAIGAGLPVVNDSDLIKMGAKEINRTRDFVAQTSEAITLPWPVAKGGTGGTNKATARTALGISSGSAPPSGGDPGDIYFQFVE